MDSVESQLYEWGKMYRELTEAEHRLQQAKAFHVMGSEMTVELQARIERLRRESDGALRAIHAALAAQRTQEAAHQAA